MKLCLLTQMGCVDLDHGTLVPYLVGKLERAPKPVDQFHVAGPVAEQVAELDQDLNRSAEREKEARLESKRHEKEIVRAEAHWREVAKAKDWDTVRADLDVYRYSGTSVKKDPRTTPEYRKLVVDGLGFGKESTRQDLTPADRAAVAEVLNRKAAAFWVEDTPRTALRHLLHDTIPTGPPCRTPPHRLRGEEADWVDEQLQKEVLTGQLERGNSEWASPPFATKEFAKHRNLGLPPHQSSHPSSRRLCQECRRSSPGGRRLCRDDARCRVQRVQSGCQYAASQGDARHSCEVGTVPASMSYLWTQQRSGRLRIRHGPSLRSRSWTKDAFLHKLSDICGRHHCEDRACHRGCRLHG